jgi:hypothetical protein
MLLGLLERLAMRRKRQGASGLWTGVAFAAFLLRQYQKRADRGGVSLREELRPGETLVISHTTQPQG